MHEQECLDAENLLNSLLGDASRMDLVSSDAALESLLQPLEAYSATMTKEEHEDEGAIEVVMQELNQVGEEIMKVSENAPSLTVNPEELFLLEGDNLLATMLPITEEQQEMTSLVDMTHTMIRGTEPPAKMRSNSSRKISSSSDEGICLSTSSASPKEEPIPEELPIVDDAAVEEFDLSSVTVKTNDLSTIQPLVDPESIPYDPNAKCYVCREKAGKHNYYGGRVCPSCRAFFRRAVQSKYYEIFFCAKGEKCEMNLNTRRSCQYCRFKKCLESGMRIAWVLPDGERARRFNKLKKYAGPRNKVKNKKDEGRQQQMLVTARKKAAPVIDMSNEEWDAINQVHK